MTAKLVVALLFLARIALAANPKDEATARNAYAKLAYAAQVRTVYDEALQNPDLSLQELNKTLQANELRFEITGMTSGALSEIDSRPYSEFVPKPDKEVLAVGYATNSVSEFGKLLAVSVFARPEWTKTNNQSTDWNVSIKEALAHMGDGAKYSRYVAATITATFQGKSQTCHSLWLFSDSDVLPLDPMTGGDIAHFVKESVFPSVLTSTHWRTFAAVNDWLTSNQSFDTSCRAGKQDVCCDSAMHCGVLAEDLRNTHPALNPMTEGKIQ